MVGEDFDVLALTLDENIAHSPEKVNAIGREYQGRSVITQLDLDGRPVKFQLDTGAACNVLRQCDLPKTAALEETQKVLHVYNGETIRPLGVFKGTLRNTRTGKARQQEFYVVPKAGISLLGLETCQAMTLLTVHYENLAGSN